MDSIFKHDEVVLIKELNDKVKNVGDTFEIANVLEDSFVIRNSKSKVAVGVVSYSDFDSHFVKKEERKGWTNWTSMIGFDGNNDCVYRTNFRKVQVKLLTSKIRGEACCSKVNDFDLSFGVHMAYMRALNKAYEKKKIEIENELKEINHEIAENNNIMKRMINSLEV